MKLMTSANKQDGCKAKHVDSRCYTTISKSIYEGVIRPLADHLKIWKVDMPY